MIYILVGLVFGVFGGICSAVAHGKQRNPVGWFAVGFLLCLIGLILICALPSNQLPEHAPAAYSPSQSLETLEQLATLRDRGAISAQEFDDKKQALLRRV